MTHTIDNQIIEGLADIGRYRVQCTIQATANSILNLSVSSTGYILFTGSVAGQILKLGDASTYQIGHTYLIHNSSTQNVVIQNNAGTAILTLLPNNRTNIVLEINTTAEGTWRYNRTSNVGAITLAEGQVAFGDTDGSVVGSNNLFWDNVNNHIGIGTNTPESQLHVLDDSGANLIFQLANNSLGESAFFECRKARGTNASKIAVTTDDKLGGWGGFGWSGTQSLLSTYMNFYAERPFTATSAPGYFSVFTTPVNSITPVERLRITSAGVVQIGPAGATIANNPLGVGWDVNSFAQVNIQNINAGNTASSDYVATANNGTETTNYIDMGINSSTYSDPTFTINGPYDGYLYTSDGDLAIGCASAKALRFFTGGTLTANERAQISPAGNLLVGTTTDNTLDKIQISRGSSVNFPVMEMFDDFLWTTLGSGTNPYSVVSAVTGSGAAITVETTATNNDYMGMITASTGTTTTGHAVIDFFNSVNKIRIGGRRIFFEARVQIPTLSVAAQTFTVQIGIEDGNAAGLPANGIFFSYTHGTNSGQWVGVSRAGSTSTPINSSVAVVAGQWYELRAEINAARTVIEYYIDGVLIGTNNASNIPGATSGMRPMFQIDKSAGSTARTLLADYMYLKMFR